jgi:hypothetical protein
VTRQRVIPSRASDLPGREWRQFKLLVRDSWRRLLQSLVFARDADPLPFLIWGVALAMTPPLVTSLNRVLRYGTATVAAADPAAIAAILTRDRLFFVIYGMLALALLAALIWDALFPDRTDQEIVGVLPVRPRTLAAARLTASVGMAAAFAGALSVPAGVFFSFAQMSLPGSAPYLRLLAGHVLATMGGAMFVFLALMTFRGVIAISAGERVAARVAVALLLLTVVSFVEVFMFLPGVLAALSRQMQAGLNGPSAIPLIWFAALYTWVAEGEVRWLALAATALAATALSALTVVALSLAPAAWIGRRVLEASSRERAGGLMVVARAIARMSIRSAPVRGIFLFAVASLMRSRRHALVLATYLGLAIAISVVQLISATYTRRGLVLDVPSASLLTVPMLCLFFAVVALRSSFAIPIDVDANWPFRLAPPTARQAVGVTRRLLLVLGVIPIVALWLAASASVWPLLDALTSSLFILISGMALTEIAIANWTKVPFATAHEPASATMRSKWPLYVFAVHVWGFIIPEGQLVALRNPTGAMWYVGFAAAVTVVFRMKREYNLRRQTPTFDAVDTESIEVLNLSEASS